MGTGSYIGEKENPPYCREDPLFFNVQTEVRIPALHGNNRAVF